MAMAFTLLDSEVTFAAIGTAQVAVEKRIQQLTYAKKTTAAQADYIFITQGVAQATIHQVIAEAKNGTLLRSF